MALEIIMRRGSYGAFKFALLDIAPDYKGKRYIFNARKVKGLDVLIVRSTGYDGRERMRERMETAKQRIEAMGLKTLFFHKKLGYDFGKHLPDGRRKDERKRASKD